MKKYFQVRIWSAKKVKIYIFRSFYYADRFYKLLIEFYRSAKEGEVKEIMDHYGDHIKLSLLRENKKCKFYELYCYHLYFNHEGQIKHFLKN